MTRWNGGIYDVRRDPVLEDEEEAGLQEDQSMYEAAPNDCRGALIPLRSTVARFGTVVWTGCVSILYENRQALNDLCMRVSSLLFDCV